jgi:bifunctional ADP-heptose synthase (sugar kinase/adenylyltransferase)
LDTRRKIVDVEQARALAAESGGSLRIVTGYFDPLLAGHAAALAEGRVGAGGLLLLLRTPPDPLLPLRSRVELVAALRTVDWVAAIPGDTIPEWVRALPASRLVSFESDDEDRRSAFLRHIHERHRLA